ncbi:MAG: polysaccharide biosynthesis tyrosine autokinase [Mariprofundaceae bacterium]|nr:polysaccharide biosynthesis tyrosine autokinase [Mariprofundaceae bacterium]
MFGRLNSGVGMHGGSIEEGIDLTQYWMVVKRRKWSIIILALLVALLATLVTYSMTPFYKATSTLLVEAHQTKMLSIEDLYKIHGDDKIYYLTQLEILKSRKLAVQVIHQLDLDKNSEILRKSGGIHLLTPLKNWLGLSDTKVVHQNLKHPIDHTFNLIVLNFQSKLSVALIKNTQLITLTFEAANPQLAADIANAMANIYIDDQLASRVDMMKKASLWMEKRLKILKLNLDISEHNLQDYMEKNNLVDVKGVSSLTAQTLDELTSRLGSARSKYSELSKRYGAKHPLIIAAYSQVMGIKLQIIHYKHKIQLISRKEVKLRELQRQVHSNRSLYDSFLKRLKEANQAVDLEPSNARILDPAIAPLAPFKPKKKLIILLAFFASLLFGVMLAFLIEALDKTFKSSLNIEEKLGLPILGLLPLIKANRKNRKAQVVAMLDDQENIYAEAMRTIRTGLILSGLDNPHKVILIASSIPGEGKTSVSSNLAIAMGRMEKVLLIEGDLRRPSLSKSFGILNNQLGLTNIMAGTSEITESVHHLEEGGIDILPSGQLSLNPLELLSSKRFELLLEKFEKDYDRIIIDSPPLQTVSDALVLSKYAKAVVYVIEANRTHENIVKNDIKRLIEHNAPIVGVILNKFDIKQSSTYEHGAYYDQYGYSSSDT